MKKIETIIRPEQFPELHKQLHSAGIKGLTVTEVAGYGLQKGKTGVYRGNVYDVTLLPKIKVELVTTNEDYETIIGIIKKTCNTGKVGDGKIFVYPLENVIRIRTGDEGTQAI
ncbi:P-II family nitrogen regulator [Desulfuribacillus alkaliarsenatis]|uniref:Transcriptional regulator n=1 Tax=Desulfuribacillus alkaliarsenatis TaxID=766136 RepID=A0A1E5G1V7_9FIRM|nr:P-II family nitrogen regulator [Desulfuribacillus alkaliarsenatis]OEF96509.1 transcriptional regulator [Desulfuribacillus alkaliarsenatis]